MLLLSMAILLLVSVVVVIVTPVTDNDYISKGINYDLWAHSTLGWSIPCKRIANRTKTISAEAVNALNQLIVIIILLLRLNETKPIAVAST